MHSIDPVHLFLIICVCSGLLVTPTLNMFGVMSGQSAVDYYGEIHLSTWNSLIHTAFMPFTYMGVNLAVPAFFNLASSDTLLLQVYIFGIYVVHYMTINPFIGFFVGMWYTYPVLKAYDIYESTPKKVRRNLVWKGLALTFGALAIQEIFGHWISGDDPSRSEGVINAMLYAKYYSVAHLFQ
jgi:hypothetical protein